MAITGIEYTLFKSMREQNVIPMNGDILELGEANWYGDVDIRLLAQDIYKYAAQSKRKELFDSLNEILESKRRTYLWEIAKIYYATFFQPNSMDAIDFDGTEKAMKLDLNLPIDLKKQYDIVTNLGTAEHVFDIAQVFKTIHRHTKPGGLMLHGLPLSGWVDHGFYSLNPTFYWDIAAANQYVVVAVVYADHKPLKLKQLITRESIVDMAKNGEIAQNSLIYTIFKKASDETEFVVPIQGYYARSVSESTKKAWMELR